MQRRATAIVLSSLAGVSILLVCVGIYGVLAYVVSLKSHELGIRMALGAGTGRILRETLAHVGWPVGLGLAAGLCGARLGSHLFQSLVFQLSPTDPGVAVVAALGLVLLACVAAMVPVRRATRVDPLTALRAQ